MKIRYLLAAVLSLSSAMVNANLPNHTAPITVQEELNDKWAIPLINSYSAYRCGQLDLGDRLIENMLSTTSKEAATSVITYGFMLSYGDHLSSISFDEEGKESRCDTLVRELDPKAIVPHTAKQTLDSTESLNRIFHKIGISDSIGERRSNDLLVSLHNIERAIGDSANISVLAQACGLEDPIRKQPNLLTLINSSKMTGSIEHQDFIDITDAWVGYKQGMYWHAISLLGNAETEQKTRICSKISEVSRMENSQ